MLESSLSESRRHFTFHSGSNCRGGGGGDVGENKLGSFAACGSSDSDEPSDDDDNLPQSVQNMNNSNAKSSSAQQLNVSNALEDTILHLDQQYKKSVGVYEETKTKVAADEVMLEDLKRQLREERVKTQDVHVQLNQLAEQGRERKAGLENKCVRMSTERKILVAEVKNLQKQIETCKADTVRFKASYDKQYAELGRAKSTPMANSSGSRRMLVEEALAQAKMLRLSLADVNSPDGISRVQTVVEELGTGDTPHQDLMEHLRELLHERCITVGAAM